MRWPYVAEYPVIGWEMIWKLLFHVQNKHGKVVPLMSLYALRQYRREELLTAGVVFMIHVGPLRHVRYCAWPSKVKEWIGSEPSTNPEGEIVEPEYGIRTWEGIWRFLFHTYDGKGLVPMMSLRTLRDKHYGNLSDCRCVCKYRRQVIAWPARTRTWIQLMAEKGNL